jgi:hypothetical protein
VTTAAAPRSARTAVRLGSWLSVRRQRRPSPPRRGALSTKARFRGPLVAQTSIERLAQPCGAGLTPRSKGPANEAVQRSSSPSVVVPDSACHAGGRGFESRRSRKSPCKSAPSSRRRPPASLHPAQIPHENRPGIAARSRAGRKSPQQRRPADIAGGRSEGRLKSGGLQRFASIQATAQRTSRVDPATDCEGTRAACAEPRMR